ncbi:NACHT domain-containing protein [Micromonospora sp. NPDC049048]|uniref:NACHT domain-containing protein n=1 Tax=Micromonospora sp. NPDC049048 TaxID=3364263 RepID=UPI00371475FE
MRRFLGPLTVVLAAVLAVVVNLATSTVELPSWLDEGIWVPFALVLVAYVWVEWRRGQDEPQLPEAEQLVAAADVLARATLSQWSAQSEAWGIGTTADPVRVTWRWDHERSLPTSEVFGRTGGKVPRSRGAGRRNPAADGRGERGVVSDLHADLYRRIQRHQLVLLGPAGSGKTAAMLMLLVEAAEECVEPVLTGGHAGTPVPVWVTLGGWNPDERSLLDHVASELETTFRALRHPRYGARAARRLIDERRVALFLDGLDEMPLLGQQAALDVIAHEASGLRVVLTSQVEGYDSARAGGRLPRPVVLQLDPVGPDTAAEYLRRGHDDDRRRRFWRRIADHLHDRPDSPVAQAFATPLILSLARDAFDGPDGEAPDPAELLGLSSVAEVKAHVIGQFLERAYPTGSRPRDRRDRRRNRRHLFYLSWIAHHLRGRRDLRWWEIPTWVPYGPLSVVVAIGFGLSAAVLAGTYVAVVHGAGSDRLWTLLGAFFAVAGIAGACVRPPAPSGEEATSSSSPGGEETPPEPIGMNLRWPTRAELRTLWALGSGLPLTVGVGTGFLVGPFAGVLAALSTMVPLIFGSSVGRANVTFGLLGIWLKPLADSPASTPDGTFRADRSRTAVAVISNVVFGGVLFTLFEVVYPPQPEAWSLGPEVGLVAGMMYGIISGLGPAVLTGFTQLVLLLRGRPPIRFTALFRESLRRQVLRQAGVVYQFRHAELQDHLAAAYQRRLDAGPAPRRSTAPRGVASGDPA